MAIVYSDFCLKLSEEKQEQGRELQGGQQGYELRRPLSLSPGLQNPSVALGSTWEILARQRLLASAHLRARKEM